MIDDGINVNISSRILGSPLHIACYIGDLEIVKFLVSKGIIIDDKTRNFSTEKVKTGEYERLEQTPLYTASERGFHDIVDFLLDK